jgi:uncharacterized protein YceK
MKRLVVASIALALLSGCATIGPVRARLLAIMAGA